MANMDIFLTDLRIFWFTHFLTFIQKNLQHNFIKQGRGVRESKTVYKMYKKTDAFHEGKLNTAIA